MESFIDIYTKLIIAIISFIAPLIVYMLSVYSEGLAIIRSKARIEIDQIGELLKNTINQNSGFDSKIVEKSNKELKDSERKNKVTARLLNPKRQIYRIFSPLLFSLLMVMIDKLNRYSVFWTKSHVISVVLLLLSFFSSVIAILILKQVAWKVIETKEMLGKVASEKEKENMETIKSIISNSNKTVQSQKITNKRLKNSE